MSIDTSSRVIVRTIAALKKGIPYILHQGGTNSGKTFGILYSLLFFALTELKPGNIVSIVSQNLPHLKKGAIRDFAKIISMTGMSDHIIENKSDHTFLLKNGVRFEFYAPDDEEKAKSGKRDILFINEGTGMKWSVAHQLMMRTNGPVIIDWNPSHKFWFHRMLMETGSVEDYNMVFTRTTYRDNKHVSEKIVQEIERLKIIDPVKYQVYGLGLDGKSQEIIYPHYEIVSEFPDTINVGTGLDFGFTNHPSTAIRCALYDGCLWFDEIFYRSGMSNKMIYDELSAYPHELGTTTGDSAEPKSISEIRGYGLDIVGAVKGPDSIRFGIEQIKKYPIKITKWSHNIISEIDGYKWKVHEGEVLNEPAKNQTDHAMDAMRYGIQSVLAPVEPIKVYARQSSDFGFTQFGV